MARRILLADLLAALNAEPPRRYAGQKHAGSGTKIWEDDPRWDPRMGNGSTKPLRRKSRRKPPPWATRQDDFRHL